MKKPKRYKVEIREYDANFDVRITRIDRRPNGDFSKTRRLVANKGDVALTAQVRTMFQCIAYVLQKDAYPEHTATYKTRKMPDGSFVTTLKAPPRALKRK